MSRHTHGRRSAGRANPFTRMALWLAVALACMGLPGPALHAEDTYYTEEKVYNSRPNPDRGKPFGHIGPTGIVVYINDGVQVTVESVIPGTPAQGMFAKGDVVRGVNGTMLRGKNPYVVLGKAITEAEAADGKLVFDVQSGESLKKVTLRIPVLGRYRDTWPLNCPKSKKIIAEAADYYHKRLMGEKVDGIPGVKDETQGIPGALMCLFLLSTGDDAHLPVVKHYFKPFIANPQGIGDHTWNNGYNGIACAEYYLRTGDKEVLPVLQYYCDNAKERQKFGSAWPHWGRGINPRYVAGGLMNPASVQVLTTLLLAKQCDVDVDDATLLGSLKFFYRFVGHGTVPYGDHRSEGGLGSNGKDGMVAAAMQAAMASSGGSDIYESARDYLSMSTLRSYPTLVTGHGDNGRGDGIWRGLSAAYLMEKRPAEYRAMMDRLTWWFDLSRYANGAMGMATCGSFNEPGSGAGVLLAFTAPLKTLQITGAPRSPYAKDFKLPAHLWGRPADLAFHGIEHHPAFARYGKEDPPDYLLPRLGTAYSKIDEDKKLSRQALLKNVHHHRYMFRAQAAKALRDSGALDDLEQLLSDSDPRVRRAALDGIIDWRYWFAMGRDPLKTDQYTPEMIDAIVKMIRDPNEALWVVDGALFAMRHMPAEVIEKNLDAIIPWTTHEEWWLRQSSFAALQGLEKDEALYEKVLPRLTRMMVDEYHTMPRSGMTGELTRMLKRKGADSPIGKLIVAGFKKATTDTTILPAPRTPEGTWNLTESVRQCIEAAPEAALPTASLLRERLPLIDTGNLLNLIAATGGKTGFHSLMDKLDAPSRQAMSDLLYEVYRPELVKRMKADSDVNLALVDTILALTQLKQDVAGWQVLGKPALDERTWRYTSIDPVSESERMPPRDRKRFREMTIPDKFAGWFKPDFDDRNWSTGPAPIGKGTWANAGKVVENRSPWGEGEFLLARTTFNVDSLDYDLYRLSILANQGYHVYLNGHRIVTYIWWNDTPTPRHIHLEANKVKHLRKGVNTLAVYCNVEYPAAMKPWRWKDPVRGQIDCHIEALRKSDLH